MDDSIFSSSDRDLFFNVLTNVNEHLHHVKNFDVVDDVMESFDSLRKLIIESSGPIQKLFEATGVPENYYSSKKLKRLIDNFFRKKIDFEDQYEGIKNSLNEAVSIEDVEGLVNLWDRIFNSSTYNKNEAKIKEDIRKVHSARIEMIGVLKIIFNKLQSFQNDRKNYQKLIGETLARRNERISSIISNIEESRELFMPLIKGSKRKSKATKTQLSNEIENLLRNFVDMKTHLNDLNIERNKMKSFVRFYPAYRDELTKRRSKNIRRPLSGEQLEEVMQFVNLQMSNSNFFSEDDRQEILDKFSEEQIFSRARQSDLRGGKLLEKEELLELTNKRLLIKEDKINLRALKVFHNLSRSEASSELFFKSIRSEKVIKHLGQAFTWKDFSKYIATITGHEAEVGGFEIDNSKTEELIYKEYLNWKLNDLLEEANFRYILGFIDEILDRILKRIKPEGLSSSRRNSYGEWLEKFDHLITEIKKKEIFTLKRYYVCIRQELTKKANSIVDPSRFYSELDAEVQYFVNCTKGHIKWYNNRIYSRLPVEFKTFQLVNNTIKSLFDDGNYELSSHFRYMIFQIDRFFEFHFEPTLLKTNLSEKFKKFDKLEAYIRLNLDKLQMGKYALLNEYLHSSHFHQVTDRLQIYGGAFGIWNKQEGEMVRLQDRRYCDSKYRPSIKDKDSKWYDLAERMIKNDGWENNPYEDSINLMFLGRSSQVKPEFFQNLGSDENWLNDIDKRNNTLFCEDGEISAFVLIYRFLNALVHTPPLSLSNKSEIRPYKTLNFSRLESGIAFLRTPELIIRKGIKELDKGSLAGKLSEDPNISEVNYFILHLAKFPSLQKNSTTVKLDRKVVLQGMESFQQIKEIFETEIFKARSTGVRNGRKTDIPYAFLNKDSNNLLDLFIYLNMNICLCEKFIHSKKFRDKLIAEINLSRIDISFLDFKHFIVLYKFLLNLVKKNLIQGFISLDFDREGRTEDDEDLIQFAAKKIDTRITKMAYDEVEATALHEKFYNERDSRIPVALSSFLKELSVQGLVKYSGNPNLKKGSFITVTERYVNLCKFIEKELDPNKIPLKVKCNYQPEFRSAINHENFFVDKQLSKLRKRKLEEGVDRDILRLEVKFREKLLDKVAENINNVVEEDTREVKIPLEEFYLQLASILSLCLESLQSYFTRSDKSAIFLKEFEAYQISKTAEAKNELWESLKQQIDRMSKFPISASFLWRANSTHAFSQLVIPLSSSCTSKKISHIGFLMLGLRNIIENNRGKSIHITHNSDKYFKELVFTLRTLFQPLINPYLDKVYYDQILNHSVIEHARNSAGSQVMARNFAHHIGSSVKGRLVDGPSWEAYFNQINFGHVQGKNKGLDAPKFDLIARWNNYERGRMDLLADISTEGPQFSSPTKFVDIVTFFYQREPGNTFQRLQILLDFMSGISDKKADSIFIDFIGSPNLVVAVPHDTLGFQAFYVILENIIRNTFKHTNPGLLKGGHFDKVRVILDEDSRYESDRFIKIDILIKYENEDSIVGYQEIPEMEGQPLDKYLNQINDMAMIDPESYQVRTQNWGLLEMKIAAAYLRRMGRSEIDNIYDMDDVPPLLTFDVVERDDDSTEFFLSYSLYFEKPKLLLINSKMQGLMRNDQKVELSNFGIHFADKGMQKVELEEADYEFYAINKNSDSIPFSPVQRRIGLETIQRVILRDPVRHQHILSQAWISWIQQNANRNFRYLDVLIHFDEGEEQTFRFEGSQHKKVHPQIIFDNHGKQYSRYFGAQEDSNTPYFYGYYDSKSKILSERIEKLKNSDSYDQQIQLGMLIEAANLGVIIFDERIQVLVDKESRFYGGKSITQRELLSLARIYVPEIHNGGLALNLNIRDNLTENIFLEWLEEALDKYTKLHYFLVHIGLIEVVVGSGEKEIQRFIDVIRNRLNLQVILISGRGNPANLPNNTYFLNTSILTDYLLNRYDKVGLIQILYNLQRYEK